MRRKLHRTRGRDDAVRVAFAIVFFCFQYWKSGFCQITAELLTRSRSLQINNSPAGWTPSQGAKTQRENHSNGSVHGKYGCFGAV